MRILHFFPAGDAMVSEHVAMLCEGMGPEADNHMANVADDARTLLGGAHYDILHLHGCWNNASRTVVNLALAEGTRLVCTPHGQLEPWVMHEDWWTEKMAKRWLYQSRIVRQAYAVIIQGKMEQECMQQLGWNPRTVIVRNAVITHSITRQEMARQTFAVYRRVMDSDTLSLMNEETVRALRDIIMAGIMGDVRWLQVSRHSSVSGTGAHPTTYDAWRQLLCYAHQEQMMDTVQRGIRIMGLDAPDIDMAQIPYFLPDGFRHADSVAQALGNQFASENERLLATFRYLRKLAGSRQLGIRHLVELTRELCRHGSEEDVLTESLRERSLYKSAARIVQAAHDLTGLPEGFMPVAPLNDRAARRLRRQVETHLTI